MTIWSVICHKDMYIYNHISNMQKVKGGGGGWWLANVYKQTHHKPFIQLHIYKRVYILLLYHSVNNRERVNFTDTYCFINCCMGFHSMKFNTCNCFQIIADS